MLAPVKPSEQSRLASANGYFRITGYQRYQKVMKERYYLWP